VSPLFFGFIPELHPYTEFIGMACLHYKICERVALKLESIPKMKFAVIADIAASRERITFTLNAAKPMSPFTMSYF
jgi:hypothetical protein